jgi:hypothetical protein
VEADGVACLRPINTTALRFSRDAVSIQRRDRSAKQVRRTTQVEPIFFEQGFGSLICSVCYVGQFRKP